MNVHERLQELIAADALGAADVDRDDDRALLDHLVECGECRELFRQFRETAADLALAAEPAEITPAFERRVLAVAAERARPSRGRWSRRAVAALVAACLAIAALAGGAAVYMAERAQRSEAMLATLADPSARTTQLTSTSGPGTISLTVTSHSRGVMLGSGLRVPAGKVLVLWLVSSHSGPQRLAVVTPDDGAAIAPFTLNLSADIDALAVTIEDGPVEKPTTDPIFTGSFGF